MSLILAYINDEFTVMAADRRLTNMNDGSFIKDTATKLIVLHNRVAIGFVGLACVGKNREPTMQWLARCLSKAKTFDSEYLSKNLRKKLLETPGKNCKKRLALIISGYDDKNQSFLCLISNMHRKKNNCWFVIDQAEDEFITSVVKFKKGVSTLRAIGWTVPKNIQKLTMERLRKTHRSRNDLPSLNTIINILAGTMKGAAGQYVSEVAQIVAVKKNGSGIFTLENPPIKSRKFIKIDSPYVVSNGIILKGSFGNRDL